MTPGGSPAHSLAPCFRFTLWGPNELIVAFGYWCIAQRIIPTGSRSCPVDRDEPKLGWFTEGYVNADEAERVGVWLRENAPDAAEPPR